MNVPTAQLDATRISTIHFMSSSEHVNIVSHKFWCALVFIVRIAPKATPVAMPCIKLSRAHGYCGRFRTSSSGFMRCFHALVYQNTSKPGAHSKRNALTFTASFHAAFLSSARNGLGVEPLVSFGFVASEDMVLSPNPVRLNF